jgi:hypothetical protein
MKRDDIDASFLIGHGTRHGHDGRYNLMFYLKL